MEGEHDLVDELKNFVQWHASKKDLYLFAHEHPLTFYHEKANQLDDVIRCDGCTLPVNQYAKYECSECQKFFHKSCAELPIEIKHPSHGLHSLLLLQDFSRNLPWVVGSLKDKFKCSGCNFPIRDIAYGCTYCGVFLHKFCLELPPVINHLDHPSHRLLLNYDSIGGNPPKLFWCKPCGAYHTGLNYSCESCDCKMGFTCIFKRKTTTSTTTTNIKSRSRSQNDGDYDDDAIAYQGHILDLLLKQPDQASLNDDCLSCGKRIASSKQPIFHCKECKFSLHSTCAIKSMTSMLPHKVDTTIGIHKHPLTLITAEYHSRHEIDYSVCDICETERDPWLPVYSCESCFLSAHTYCSLPLPIPSILPSIAKAKYHRHLLHLGFSDGDSSNCYDLCCLVWGIEKDPKLPVYRCEQCIFEAHVTCVLQKMGLSLVHKLDSVVLDISPTVIYNPPSTISEIIESTTGDEKKRLYYTITAATLDEKAGVKKKSPNGQQDDVTQETLNEPTYSHEELEQNKERFDSRCRDPRSGLRYYNTKSQVTEVDGHLIPHNLAPVVGVLFSLYEDFSVGCQMGRAEKTFIFMVLCAAVYSLCNTKVGEITETQLYTCWDCFKVAKIAGFSVEFALSRLRYAMNEYFGLQNTACIDAALAKLDSSMAKISLEMDVLEEKSTRRVTNLPQNASEVKESIEIVDRLERMNSWDEYWIGISGLDKTIDRLIVSEGYLNASEELPRQTQQYSNSMDQGQSEAPLKQALNAKDNSQIHTLEKVKEFIEKHILKERSLGESSIECKFDYHEVSLLEDNKEEGHTRRKTSRKSRNLKPNAPCFACELPRSSYPTYHCLKCEIFLHDFCARLPEQIEHPLHLSHRLSVEVNSERFGKSICNACGEKCRGCCYSCQKCNFYLEIRCLFRKPTVKCQSHGMVIELEDPPANTTLRGCFVCRKNICRPPFLHCAPCNVSLHTQCA